MLICFLSWDYLKFAMQFYLKKQSALALFLNDSIKLYGQNCRIWIFDTSLTVHEIEINRRNL